MSSRETSSARARSPCSRTSCSCGPCCRHRAWIAARQTGTDAAGRLLIVLGGLIGVGSYLFHTHAVTWAELADTVPIWGFVGAYVLAVVLRMHGRPVPVGLALAVVAGFAEDLFEAGDGLAAEPVGVGEPVRPARQLAAVIVRGELHHTIAGLRKRCQVRHVHHLFEQRARRNRRAAALSRSRKHHRPRQEDHTA